MRSNIEPQRGFPEAISFELRRHGPECAWSICFLLERGEERFSALASGPDPARHIKARTVDDRWISREAYPCAFRLCSVAERSSRSQSSLVWRRNFTAAIGGGLQLGWMVRPTQRAATQAAANICIYNDGYWIKVIREDQPTRRSIIHPFSSKYGC